MFVQFTSLQYSAWMLVIMSLDRYFTIKIATWKKTYLTPNRALILCYLLVVLIVLLHINVLFTFGHEIKSDNNTIQIQCYHTPNITETEWMMIWGSVS
jgi:hypothetical protein